MDAEGNCQPCEGFLFLPDNDTGRTIREVIKQEMPGLVIKEWDYQLDPSSRSIRKGSDREQAGEDFDSITNPIGKQVVEELRDSDNWSLGDLPGNEARIR